MEQDPLARLKAAALPSPTRGASESGAGRMTRQPLLACLVEIHSARLDWFWTSCTARSDDPAPLIVISDSFRSSPAYYSHTATFDFLRIRLRSRPTALSLSSMSASARSFGHRRLGRCSVSQASFAKDSVLGEDHLLRPSSFRQSLAPSRHARSFVAFAPLTPDPPDVQRLHPAQPHSSFTVYF